MINVCYLNFYFDVFIVAIVYSIYLVNTIIWLKNDTFSYMKVNKLVEAFFSYDEITQK